MGELGMLTLQWERARRDLINLCQWVGDFAARNPGDPYAEVVKRDLDQARRMLDRRDLGDAEA